MIWMEIDKRIKVVDEYLDFLKYQKNYSDYTISSYLNDIYEYMNYISSEGIDYKTIEYSDIRFYLMYLKENKQDNNSSIDRKLSSLRGFYKYLANEGVVSSNVFSLVNGPKRVRSFQDILNIMNLRKCLMYLIYLLLLGKEIHSYWRCFMQLDVELGNLLVLK